MHQLAKAFATMNLGRSASRASLRTKLRTLSSNVALTFAVLAGVFAASTAASFDTSSLPVSATATDNPAHPHMRASLLLTSRADNSRAGVLFDLEPGWHVYWKNPGDTGLAPELDWTIEQTTRPRASGITVGDIEWPTPIAFEGSGGELVSYGYADHVLLASPLTGYEPGAHISVAGSILICKDECIPVDFTLSRVAPITPPSEEAELFDTFHARVPRTPEALGFALRPAYSSADLQPGDSFEAAIAIECGNRDSATCEALLQNSPSFFPDEETYETLSISSVGITSHPSRDGAAIVRMQGTVEPDADSAPTQFGGVFRISDAIAVEVQLPFPAPGASAKTASIEIAPAWMNAAPPQVGNVNWLRVLLLALVGGLILNGMPCVLPVLGIKICSAAELAQHDPAQLRRHGFAYLAGVLASMAALAVAVIALKAAGASVGWGFQFQEPVFVAAVAAVVVLFALNLFGVFEIQISTSRIAEVGASTQGPTRSFFDGLLAVVLATPCTAPFLGTAVGFAFAGGGALIFATFIAIGAGLAAPYVLICLIPGWSRFVPRAGGWMLRLRAGLGFLLLATAVWLVWIFGRTAGVDAQAALLAVLVALSFGAWLFGWVQTQARPIATVAAALALVLFGSVAINKIEATAAAASTPTGDEPWVDYDATAIESALEAGNPVFVSFTADWCITCKVNERGVLADDEVLTALNANGLQWFRGDWTQRNEAIRAELARHGRAGVPLYLVYDPNDPKKPQILPELLSVDLVVDAFASAGSK
jgi:thiol:disulfide interchange protein/DsbC/DsbD-like thiol-disulfide interchange protein